MNSERVSVSHLVDESMTFDPATVNAARAFARAKPWRGTVDERKAKFKEAFAALASALGHAKPPRLVFGVLDGSDSVASNVSARRSVRIIGRLSVVTMLWCLARVSRDPNPMRWAVNLFRVAFPKSFARCDLSGGYVRNPNRVSAV